MAANTSPIFARVPNNQGYQSSNLAVSLPDGTGANVVSIFQADTTEGGFVDEIRLKPLGSPAATVVRVYLCSVTGAYTAGVSNTVTTAFCIGEMSLAAVTSSTTVAQNDLSIPIRKGLDPGHRILIGFGTLTGAATGYAFTVFGSKY